MYSVMSMRTMLRSSSKRHSARLLASSVLPTPVGPRKRKLPMGLLGSEMPARERWMASVTRRTASSWPTTRRWMTSSRCSSFSRSPSISLETGMPVHLATMLAISSSVTVSCTSVSPPARFSARCSASSSCFCSAGRSEYLSRAAFSYSSAICAFSMSAFICSISPLMRFTSSTPSRSDSQRAFIALNLSFCSASSARSFSRRSRLSWSSSFFRAISSISSCMMRRRMSSSSLGMESISVRIMAQASSTRSMALSGRKRSVI